MNKVKVLITLIVLVTLVINPFTVIAQEDGPAQNSEITLVTLVEIPHDALVKFDHTSGTGNFIVVLPAEDDANPVVEILEGFMQTAAFELPGVIDNFQSNVSITGDFVYFLDVEIGIFYEFDTEGNEVDRKVLDIDSHYRLSGSSVHSRDGLDISVFSFAGENSSFGFTASNHMLRGSIGLFLIEDDVYVTMRERFSTSNPNYDPREIAVYKNGELMWEQQVFMQSFGLTLSTTGVYAVNDEALVHFDLAGEYMGTVDFRYSEAQYLAGFATNGMYTYMYSYRENIFVNPLTSEVWEVPAGVSLYHGFYAIYEQGDIIFSYFEGNTRVVSLGIFVGN